PVQQMELPKAPKDSWEAMCHEAGEQFYLNSDDLKVDLDMRQPIPHRAVGVVYRPTMERYGNFVPSIISERYDHFLFFDRTSALHNIDISSKDSMIPETFPFGL